MNFKTNKVVTGLESRKSKKTDKSYIIINYLNDNGSTFSSMADESLIIPKEIKQLSPVEVDFEVTFYNGNVSGLKTVGLKLVS